jgi:hypothetical protein
MAWNITGTPTKIKGHAVKAESLVPKPTPKPYKKEKAADGKTKQK